MTDVFGWRVWVAAGNVAYAGKYRRAMLGSPFRSGLIQSDEEDLLFGPVVPAARCWLSSHPVPQAQCMCGHRGVREIGDVIAYVRRALPTLRNCAFVRVEAVGSVLPGVVGVDPDGTWRSSGLRIVGPIALSPSQAKHAAAFAAVFKVRVVPGRGGHERWLAALEAQPPATGAKANPPSKAIKPTPG